MIDDAGKFERLHILKRDVERRKMVKDVGGDRVLMGRQKRMGREGRKGGHGKVEEMGRQRARVTLKDGGNKRGRKTGRNERDVKKERRRRAGRE